MTQQQSTSRVSKDAFLEFVRRSGLLSPELLAEAMERVPSTERGRVVARHFVEQGFLTKFQAERLLAGRTDGYFMGQYRILEELGRGGMGWVFKAEHMTMSRLVALKILNSSLVKTDRARDLFQREVKAAAKLNHPNIVTAFDANQVDDRCYLVMEFVDGPNLQDLVKERGPLPIALACDYIRQAAVGLEHAHTLGMVHRDIKPANLLVQRNHTRAATGADIVKILDFGLARFQGSESAGTTNDSIHAVKHTVMGTPDYLSPEQARDLHSVDGRSDIYSLGCAFYFLLTGQVVFPGGTTMEKLVRHSTEAPIPIQTLRPDVPDALAKVVHRMLAKKPDDRFARAGEVAIALIPFASPDSPSEFDVDPLPLNTEVELSSSTEPDLPDPWAGIDSDEYDALSGTLPGDSTRTRVEESRRSRLVPHTRVKDGLGVWVWLLPILIVVVGAGVALVVRQLIK